MTWPMTWIVLSYAAVYGLGLLAGLEFVVMFGVRGPLKVLADEPQIILRQALIRRLRIVVPLVAMTAATLSVIMAVRDWSLLRALGLACMAAWMAATFFGTVPINKAVLSWRAEDPPANWRANVRLWEHLDTIRTCAAVAAFAFYLAALGALPPRL